MRQLGRLTQWKDGRGFGFITPKGGGEPIFVHIKAFSNRQQRPTRNDIVRYTLGFDGKSRAKAEDVAFFVDRLPQTVSNRSRFGFAVLPVLFLGLIAIAMLAGMMPPIVFGFYLVVSTVTYGVYANDKSKARNNEWRTKENTLHLLSMFGGWPGACVAQNLLHHKSKKQSFQMIFWITVLLNCAGLAWALSPSGSDQIRSLLEKLH